MVIVEVNMIIMLVGARYSSGVVQVFDSYKFESKLYYDVKHYFCSIDTWLNGICESVCPEHPWKRVAWAPGAKSIFSFDEGEMEQGYREDDDVESGMVVPDSVIHVQLD